MADTTTERLMDVVLLLLNATAPLTINQIRNRVPGYQQDDPESFKRMFERDKKALREANIPIETVSLDVAQGDAQAYILDKRDWLLTDLKLTERERMLISFAATGWQNHHMAQTAREAARQIGGRVSQVNTRNQLRLGFDQRNFPEVLEAIRLHKSLTLDYASKTSGQTSQRHIDPWQVVCRRGAWYVIGFDLDKGDMRVFKISRIIGNVQITDNEITTSMPEDFDVEAALDYWVRLVADPLTIEMKVKPGTCRHIAVLAETVDYRDGHDLITVVTSDIYGISRDIASSCHEVIEVFPEAVAQQVSELVYGALKVNG